MLAKTKNYFINIFRPDCRLLIGNPFSGKSTLANCIAKNHLFQSGLSVGTGVTFPLNSKVHDGITYMDTPGLSDIRQRHQASKSIIVA